MAEKTQQKVEPSDLRAIFGERQLQTLVAKDRRLSRKKREGLWQASRGDEPPIWPVTNLTGHRIAIRSANNESDSQKDALIIPPFGERKLSLGQLDKYDFDSWVLHGLVKVETPEDIKQARRKDRKNFLLGTFQKTRQVFALLGSFAIAVVLPVVAIYAFGDGDQLTNSFSLQLLGRVLQLGCIVVLSILPAVLYFAFDRNNLAILRKTFYREVTQLEANTLTVGDAESLYGDRVDELYGGGRAGLAGRLLRGTRWPILLATLVITAGWILSLMPIGALTADPNLQTDPLEVYRMLIPRPHGVTFGFLGAYFFALNMVIRRYTRADLKPKTYSHVTVRILTVTILVWVLGQIPGLEADEAPLLVLAFFVGIVPETALTVIREFLKKTFRFIASLDEPLPLRNLDGVTLYERARLLEEGIENIENLVHADLVDLMLQTRIPVARLVDWVDQGILHLHVTDIAHPDHSTDDLNRLREFGIRTASDLIGAYKLAQDREKFLSIMEFASDKQNKTYKTAPVSRLRIIFDALQNDESLVNILNWRERQKKPGEQVYHLEDILRIGTPAREDPATIRRINRVDPPSATPGSVISIQGQHLAGERGMIALNHKRAEAQIELWNETQVKFKLPQRKEIEALNGDDTICVSLSFGEAETNALPLRLKKTEPEPEEPEQDPNPG